MVKDYGPKDYVSLQARVAFRVAQEILRGLGVND